jgi:uncharacterized membrane protein
MRAPTEPVNLNEKEIELLHAKLGALRHDVNNCLALIMAATELLRHKPQMAERMLETLSEQPPKITASLAKFTKEFEAVVGPRS